MTEHRICELVRKMEEDDKLGQTTISKYVVWNMRENIEKVDAYLNSKHISGDTDSQGREKPFFNIVTAAANIWFRATDIDRKNIRIKPTRSDQIMLAFLATVLLGDFMRRSSFGTFLNDWGLTLSRYGSAIVKFVEKGGNLFSSVMPWSRMIVDPVDFENNPVIEKLWMTPAQLLKNKSYDQEFVRKLIDAVQVRETADGMQKDTKDAFIPIYEVHGELPLSYLTHKDKDEDTYVQQMHVVSFVDRKDNSEFDEYTLISGRESKSPYMITHLLKEDGRTMGIGAVEHLFESQWMLNHSVKAIKDQLDLASKIIFQTSDGNFVGQSALTSIENGDILIHSPNEPLTAINNRPDISALQAQAQQWKIQANEITGISEAMLGASPKSGTPWRQTEALLAESHSLFEIMTENKGLAIEKMMIEYVIPHLKKKMDTTDEVVALLEDHQIAELDAIYVPNKVNKYINEKLKRVALKMIPYTKAEYDADVEKARTTIQEGLDRLGNRRAFKPSDIDERTWKEVLRDLEWELEIDITGEQKDTQTIVTTLTTVLQSVASNPMVLQDPNMKLVFNKILSEVGGISPLELTQPKQPPIQQPVGPGMDRSAIGPEQLQPMQ